MTDLSPTAADVRPLNGAVVVRFAAGGTINVGAPVYLSAAGTVAAADGSAVATAAAIGILVATNPNAASQTAAASGDVCDVCVFGPVTGLGTVVYGTYYYVDDDAGIIADAAGTKSCIVGIGLDATTMLVRCQVVALS